jgi:hypothetical protein
LEQLREQLGDGEKRLEVEKERTRAAAHDIEDLQKMLAQVTQP